MRLPNNRVMRQRLARVPRGQQRRPAVAMAAVLVCLLVIMLLGGTLVRGMLLYHRQAETETRQLQALWLAESAATLAIEQLRDDPAYEGQTWRAAVDESTGSEGVVEIHVDPVAREPGQRRVRIKSTFPDDPVHRVVLDNRYIVTLTELGEAE